MSEDRMSGAFDVERRSYAPDVSARTKDLDALRAEHREKVAAVRADEDLTPDAKSRHLRELERDFAGRFGEESRRIMEELGREIRDADRRAFGPEKPSGDPQAELAREMRLARLRSEVLDSFMDGGHDALIDYQRAIELGDAERASIIGKVGPGFIDDPTRKRRLRELVAENEPPERKKAKERLVQLEREKQHLELGLALQQHVASRRR